MNLLHRFYPSRQRACQPGVETRKAIASWQNGVHSLFRFGFESVLITRWRSRLYNICEYVYFHDERYRPNGDTLFDGPQ